ncbi:hypothetical protein [Gloeomargarita sp.]
MLDGRKQIALLFMMNVAVSGITVILFIITGVILINSRPKNNFVQLVDGKTIMVTTVGSYERQPQTIRRFIKEVFSLMFTWNGFLPLESNIPNEIPLPDLGVSVSGGKKVATTTMYASFAFSEKLRNALLQEIALLTPQELFKPVQPGQPNRKPKVILLVEFIGDPRPVRTGTWQLEFVSNLIIFEEKAPQGRLLTPFNKIVVVRAIEPVTEILYNPTKPPESEVTTVRDKEKSRNSLEEEPIYTHIDKIVQRIRYSGLQIIELKELGSGTNNGQL